MNVCITAFSIRKPNVYSGGIANDVIICKDQALRINDDAAAKGLGDVAWIRQIEFLPKPLTFRGRNVLS